MKTDLTSFFQNSEFRLYGVSCIVFFVNGYYQIKNIKGLTEYQYRCIEFLLGDKMLLYEVEQVLANLTRYAKSNGNQSKDKQTKPYEAMGLALS